MNIADIKRELSSDEKVLESAFKLETFYKNHKIKLWIIVVALVLFFGGKEVQEVMHEAQLNKANHAFLMLQKNPHNKEALTALEANNPALLEFFLYTQAVQNRDSKTLARLSRSKNIVLADMSRYSTGILNEKPVDSLLYNDMAQVTEAYLAIKEKKPSIAKAKLELLDERSPLAVIAQFLNHSLLKEKQ